MLREVGALGLVDQTNNAALTGKVARLGARGKKMGTALMGGIYE
jgi:hypothetical protein